MKAFVFRLVPPRPGFMTGMSDDERSVMTLHGRYWTGLMEAGTVLAFGPVADPAQEYGIGIVLAQDLVGAEALRDQDPAMLGIDGMRTEIAPVVRLVTPGGVY